MKYERRLGIALVVNFLLFFVATMIIGGDALNGRIENGIYFVSSHGIDTAVHPLVWNYSATHASLVIGSIVLFFIYKAASGLWRHRPSSAP